MKLLVLIEIYWNTPEDVLNLTNGLDGHQLSFGSCLHVGDGVNSLCLVCSALADFQ